MKNIQEIGNKAFPTGKQSDGSTRSVSYPPLFIDARVEKSKTKEEWKKHRVCLLHGTSFFWKRRCGHCRYLVTFQARLN